MIVEKDQIRLDLSLVSSIMNYAGYKALLNYLSMYKYKEIVKDEYLNFEKFEKYSFIKNKNEWIHFMDKLVDMGLAIKNGTHYTVRGAKNKLKQWKSFAENNTKECFNLNGYIIFNMTNMYKLPNGKHKEVIYAELIRCTRAGIRGYSRKFIQSITGVKPNEQRKIEKNTNLIEVKEHFIPTNKPDNYKKHPIFPGKLNLKNKTCKRTKNFEDANCEVVQSGNKLKIQDSKICDFIKKKTTTLRAGTMNELLPDRGEVHSWDDCDVILDEVAKGKKKCRFFGSNFGSMKVFTASGKLLPLLNCINR